MCAIAQAITTIFTTVNLGNDARRRRRFAGRYLEGGPRIMLRRRFALGPHYGGGRGAVQTLAA
jgi:hypothetical protein